MKYAIYDKAADAYLTTMDFDTEVPDNYTQYALGYNEYITKARLLDTKEEAADVVTRIESFKFMEKGRFVIHSFDDTLKDQYIISEAGNPTKVVESITVDLDGTINVKYGTMISHWSTTSLEYAITRMNSLQKAASTIYTSWNVTFDIYKVINIIDEKGHTHYQFINVTAEGLEKYSKDEEEKLLVVGKEITDITDPLNKRIEELEKANYELGEQVTERGAVANCLLDENNSFKAKLESIKKEACHWKTMYESADACKLLKDVNDIAREKKLANDIIDICEATTDPFEVTLKKFSQLYEAVNDPGDDDDTIMYAFKGVLEIFSSLEDHVKSIIDESVTWKNKAQKAEKELEDQKKLNDANKATIAYLLVKKIAKDKELSDWKMRTEEAIRDYTKCNEALGEWKKKYRSMQEERDKAIERAEFYKRQANSIYGMTVPTRCCGKQLTADILGGKKIPISKKKYDDLVKYVSNINLTYDTIFCMMDKPVYLSTITESLNNLTK